ncbi:hypothetical protein J1N35_028896 [Gossypium stocksii]|uniref:Reverse transcriptase n=1 Tax=Gossypium stocksii TaxID=47602 RepID=A0A9D3ZSF3_9ROSI|nr:hypothetical protein J1N35_028896 [Gossypium stocksii]
MIRNATWDCQIWLDERKNEPFQLLKDRIKKRIDNWSTRHLSQGGKEVFIKAILQAIPTYTMACFLLPNLLCIELENIIAKFWWQKANGKRVATCYISGFTISKNSKSQGTYRHSPGGVSGLQKDYYRVDWAGESEEGMKSLYGETDDSRSDHRQSERSK